MVITRSRDGLVRGLVPALARIIHAASGRVERNARAQKLKGEEAQFVRKPLGAPKRRLAGATRSWTCPEKLRVMNDAGWPTIFTR